MYIRSYVTENIFIIKPNFFRLFKEILPLIGETCKITLSQCRFSRVKRKSVYNYRQTLDNSMYSPGFFKAPGPKFEKSALRI